MSNISATKEDVRAQDSPRNEVLNAISIKWDKFSKADLSELKTSDELVTQVVAKYGVEKTAAQRDVDALMAGRSLAA